MSMVFKIDMDLDTVKRLQEANTVIQEILHGHQEPLSDELRDILIKKISNYHFRRVDDPAMSISELCNFKYNTSACGCLGPSNGEPYCNCMMWAKLEDYKYDIALYIVNNQRIEGNET